LIAGIDSGTWRAFAIVDFEGNALSVESRKNWGENSFIRDLAVFSPTIIACDKSIPPRKVSILKRVFSARLYKPSKNLTVAQKHRLVEDFKVKNSHERDALASALKAFKSVSSKLATVKKKAFKAGVPKEKLHAVQKLVLKGMPVRKALENSVGF